MNDFFCGWYFKCQSENCTLAIIPAIHTHQGLRTCSLQIITKEQQWLVSLPFARIQMRQDIPYATLGNNKFSPQGIHLDLHDRDCCASGDLFFGPPSPIRYDIMGPFRYVPFLACRHSVFSMRHNVSGTLHINTADYSFHESIGYTEGDRGSSFPRHYAWTQCCLPCGSLMLSVADISFGPIQFTGIIGVIQLNGKEYRLATYLGAKAASILDGKIVIKQGNLQFTAVMLVRRALPLKAPVSGQMSRTIHENVACRAFYQFLQGQHVLLEWESDAASFEYEYPF